MGRRKRNTPSDVAKQVEESKGKSMQSVEPIVEFISTGCTLLDCSLGGGFAKGKVVNLVGDKSTGKTLIALESLAKAFRNYGKKLVDRLNDAEGGQSFNVKKMYGFELDDSKEPSDTIEDFNNDLRSCLDGLKKDQFLFYILDSLDGLSSSAELRREEERKAAAKEGKDYKGGTYNLEKQKMLGQLFRTQTNQIKSKNALLLIVSQVRNNITGYGKKYYRTGGKALDHYSCQIIWLAEKEKQIKKGRVTGVTLHVLVDKNKVGLPFRECFINVLFDYGIDDISTSIDFLYDLKTTEGKLKKASKGEESKKLKWGRKEFTRNSLITYIEDNDLEDELAQQVKDKWQAIEDSVASKRKSKYE